MPTATEKAIAAINAATTEADAQAEQDAVDQATISGAEPAAALNQLRLSDHDESLLSVVTRPTPVQKRAFRLLGVNPDQNVPIKMTG